MSVAGGCGRWAADDLGAVSDPAVADYFGAVADPAWPIASEPWPVQGLNSYHYQPYSGRIASDINRPGACLPLFQYSKE